MTRVLAAREDRVSTVERSASVVPAADGDRVRVRIDRGTVVPASTLAPVIGTFRPDLEAA